MPEYIKYFFAIDGFHGILVATSNHIVELAPLQLVEVARKGVAHEKRAVHHHVGGVCHGHQHVVGAVLEKPRDLQGAETVKAPVDGIHGHFFERNVAVDERIDGAAHMDTL